MKAATACFRIPLPSAKFVQTLAMMSMKITSTQNPRIKQLILLHEKARERKKQGLFTIEGSKEAGLAVKAGYQIETLVYCEKTVPPAELDGLLAACGPDCTLIEVSDNVYSRLAYRDSSGGVLAVAQTKDHDLALLDLPQNPLLLVVEGVEKPGNLGAILRTADAAGLDAVIVCDPHTDLYNPNAVRASIGCLFTVPLAVAPATETIAWLKQQGIGIFATTPEGAVPYHTVSFSQAAAIVAGTESSGISQVWKDAADANILIPMRGAIDSMNVSNAVAVTVFEAVRQRGFPAKQKKK